jgi:hypothetical protein
MNCGEIKKLFDQYVDNDLSKEASAAVRKHISSCRDCSTDLASLNKYKKEISLLKGVKAPADFIQQLNFRIDKQSGIKKAIKAMFFPLKIKLPIEALGVIAAAVLIVILVNPVEQIRENVQMTGKIAFKEKAVERDSEVKIADLTRSGKKTGSEALSLPAEVRDDRILAQAERKMISVRGEAVKTREIVLALYQPKSSVASDNLKNISPSARAPQSEESAGFSVMDMKKDEAAGPIMEPDRSSSIKSEKIAKTGKEAKVAETTTTQKANEQNTKDESINSQLTILQPLQDIKNIVISLNGRLVKEVLGNDDHIRYVIVDMPALTQKEFLDKLSRLGTLQPKERRPFDAGKSGTVRFKINIKQME